MQMIQFLNWRKSLVIKDPLRKGHSGNLFNSIAKRKVFWVKNKPTFDSKVIASLVNNNLYNSFVETQWIQNFDSITKCWQKLL
jgi:hypothetical protein